MKTDDTIKLEAAQDALYFTEKGFYIGLTFPGSAGIDAALQGGSGREVLSGLAGINPLTAKLAALANADNGLAAGLAVVNVATGGASMFGKSVPELGKLGIDGGVAGVNKAIGDKLNPLSQFTDENGDFSFKNFGISISSWKKQQNWTESQVSELTAGGDIVMQAGLDVLLTEGTKLIAGGDVSIDAGRDILMSALLDYAKDKSSSWGLQLSFTSIGFDIAKSKGYDEQLTNASILAAGDVSLKSGRDTALLGGNISGQNVSLDVGRDLTILSPQAQGWRDGFSFGLTIGLDLTSFGIRGSSEDGEKAWSSGSGIVAAEDIAIKVGEDTTLVGALINATDGDIKIDTGTLVSADLKDIDKYKNVGGSIGFENGGLVTLGFSYEEKDKRGETRTTLDAGGKLEVTIHDADKDGLLDTDADKAAAEQLLASINKDASNYQEILKDSHIKLSGELDVGDLRELGDNIRAIAEYNRILSEPVPGEVAAAGQENVDYYQRLRANGLSPDQAKAMLGTPQIQNLVTVQQNWNEAVAFYGSRGAVPPEIKAAIANGIDFDFSAGKPMVTRSGCETNGWGCMFEFDMQNDGPAGIKTLEEFAAITVSDAAKKIESLLPEFQDLQAAFRDGRISPEMRARYSVIEAELKSAYLAYELCVTEAGAPPLLDFVSQFEGGVHPTNLAYVKDASAKIEHKNANGQATETISPIDLVGPGGIKLTGAALFNTLKAGFASLGDEAAQKIALQVMSEMTKPGWTGSVGETALKQMFGGVGQKGFNTALGWRYVDNLAGDVAHEAKTGFVSYSSFVVNQIEKDALLLTRSDIKAVQWHFFRSPVTGQVGADPRILTLLTQKGIPYVVH